MPKSTPQNARAHCARCTGLGHGLRHRGFTLIELIMVILILGVLAVIAVPRFSGDVYTGRGLHDETLATLRFAQKTAIAQRRAVCVTVNADGLDMTMFVANPAPAPCATATPAQAPVLTSPLPRPAANRRGMGLTSTISPFQFTPLGSTDQAAAITIAVANSLPIVVEPATGYIHE